MKLNKLRLIKLTKDELNKLGYILLKDIDSGANGLYGKLISPDLFLTPIEYMVVMPREMGFPGRQLILTLCPILEMLPVCLLVGKVAW
ncbi:hypothetical protein B0O44_105355 [Pedobacter nutrimenti]|uniref:Uncharacterized protein n=1 Tax=Pedobacter nutrimenti TaxID=1241337 RepID=A0A318UC27_9SPHI|nr:hypothetical protein B0O44_105355 [Pedobacter nutrimenti]